MLSWAPECWCSWKAGCLLPGVPVGGKLRVGATKPLFYVCTGFKASLVLEKGAVCADWCWIMGKSKLYGELQAPAVLSPSTLWWDRLWSPPSSFCVQGAGNRSVVMRVTVCQGVAAGQGRGWGDGTSLKRHMAPTSSVQVFDSCC